MGNSVRLCMSSYQSKCYLNKKHIPFFKSFSENSTLASRVLYHLKNSGGRLFRLPWKARASFRLYEAVVEELESDLDQLTHGWRAVECRAQIASRQKLFRASRF